MVSFFCFCACVIAHIHFCFFWRISPETVHEYYWNPRKSNHWIHIYNWCSFRANNIQDGCHTSLGKTQMALTLSTFTANELRFGVKAEHHPQRIFWMLSKCTSSIFQIFILTVTVNFASLLAKPIEHILLKLSVNVGCTSVTDQHLDSNKFKMTTTADRH